jgi:hypothetical protein
MPDRSVHSSGAKFDQVKSDKARSDLISFVRDLDAIKNGEDDDDRDASQRVVINTGDDTSGCVIDIAFHAGQFTYRLNTNAACPQYVPAPGTRRRSRTSEPLVRTAARQRSRSKDRGGRMKK